jgi:hypothetical protein
MVVLGVKERDGESTDERNRGGEGKYLILLEEGDTEILRLASVETSCHISSRESESLSFGFEDVVEAIGAQGDIQCGVAVLVEDVSISSSVEQQGDQRCVAILTGPMKQCVPTLGEKSERR